MKNRYILPAILAIDFLLLLFVSTTLSVSYSEVRTYFWQMGVVGYLANFSTALFGQNDVALRLPMIILHIWSVYLLYKISGYYLKEERNKYILLLVFILLPGVISAALLLNSAGVVIFASFLFAYYYLQDPKSIKIYLLLGIFALIDNSFAYLFLALALYAFSRKNYEFLGYNLFLITVNVFLYGTDIGGYPTGHFLDALGVYAAIFSPIVFIYIVYILYRNHLTKKKDVLWYIATVPLIFSLLLSLRQRVHVEYYAPFVMLSLPLAAKSFLSSYRVRLPQFRKNYKRLLNISLFFLVLNFTLVLSNKYLYLFIERPSKHFAYNNHIAKELAHILKEKGINCLLTDYKMQERLAFYGINECSNVYTSQIPSKNSIPVTIRYNNKIVYQTYVTKINNQ
jgi:hypothetical protein